MSAAQWRNAMNSGAGRAAMLGKPVEANRGRTPGENRGQTPGEENRGLTPDAPAWLQWIWRHVGARHVFVMLGLLVFPWIATPFLTFQIGGQALALGLIALSLTFLGGYGGMISLAQMTIAGVAGYMVAIFGAAASSDTSISLGWPWWIALPVAIGIATAAAIFIGWLSVRTEGIYTIMITLAVGVAFYYLCLQNYSVFNGFQGFQRVAPPKVFGVDWRSPVPFYYLALFWSLAGYFFVKYILRAPFGVALQGIRDNPRRMEALGFSVTAHRVAAYALAGIIAAVGGVLFTWYNGLLTPNSVGTSWLINILIIAVLGGMRHPIGAFLGALVFVLLQTFAIDLIDRERFNLVIGGVFLAIVLFSPDGLLGLWAKLRSRFGPNQTLTQPARRRP
jgi:branched-chain amino acid transport system permease protein